MDHRAMMKQSTHHLVSALMLVYFSIVLQSIDYLHSIRISIWCQKETFYLSNDHIC